MNQLDDGYSVEVDNINKETWHNLMLEFDDISFYQTWSYGSLSWGENNLSHLILKKNNEIVSIAQLRIVKLPFLRIGFAYLTWGPLWKRKDNIVDFKHLQNMLSALYNEFVITRGFLLRVIPKQIIESEEKIKKIFEDEKFSWHPDHQQTVYVDLAPSIEDIKLKTRSKWRQTLNKAMKQELEFIDGSNDELTDIALNLVIEMKKRKNYVEFGTMEDIISVHKDLPGYLKLKFVLCKYESAPVAVMAWFAFGKLGQPLVGATGDNALKLNAAYPLWWKMIEYYKNQGASHVDLAGVNKDRNPGGYLFKTGLCGEDRLEKSYIGQFDACDNFLSYLTFRTGMRARETFRALIVKINLSYKKISKILNKHGS